MLSKEEIDNYKYFENKYLQQPITLLTKQNLELLEKHCERQVRHEVGQRLREHEIVLELLYKYKELESDKQKLIEKLENKQEEINSLNEFYETYEINHKAQAVFIDRNRLKEVIGVDKDFTIFVVNKLPTE